MMHKDKTPSRGYGAAFVAGALSGAILSIMTVLTLFGGLTTRLVPTLLADRIADLVGPAVIEPIVTAIGPLGKQALFIAVLFGQIAVGGLLAMALIALVPGLRLDAARAAARARLEWPGLRMQVGAVALATVVWLVVCALVLPLLNAGFFGAALNADQPMLLLWTFVLFQLYALSLASFYPAFARPPRKPASADAPIPAGLTRRRLVAGIAGIAVAGVGLVASISIFGLAATRKRLDLGVVQPDGTLSGEITPTAEFYHISKNAIDPRVDGTTWRLAIGGMANTRSYSLTDLMALPAHTEVATLTCISNTVGGDLISTAEWTGVALGDLLAASGLPATAQRIVFTCADGYTDSIPVADATNPHTILAYRMNGAALTPDHGYPARIVVPGIYGMKNVKWVTKIEAVTGDYLGYWQKQGWNNAALIKTESAITAPADLGLIPAAQPVDVRGYAFAGTRGISKVEISTDGGATWQPATLRPPLSPLAWTLWHYTWTPTRAATTLRVRATDGTGTLQPADTADTYPNGASGYHTISITVQ